MANTSAEESKKYGLEGKKLISSYSGIKYLLATASGPVCLNSPVENLGNQPER